MERRMGDSLLKWLGLDKPPEQRVRHKVWKKQLSESTRQLKLGADRARQRMELEMLDGTEVYRAAAAEGLEEGADGRAVRWSASTGSRSHSAWPPPLAGCRVDPVKLLAPTGCCAE